MYSNVCINWNLWGRRRCIYKIYKNETCTNKINWHSVYSTKYTCAAPSASVPLCVHGSRRPVSLVEPACQGHSQWKGFTITKTDEVMSHPVSIAAHGDNLAAMPGSTWPPHIDWIKSKEYKGCVYSMYIPSYSCKPCIPLHIFADIS